jgi:hypothetical protein
MFTVKAKELSLAMLTPAAFFLPGRSASQFFPRSAQRAAVSRSAVPPASDRPPGGSLPQQIAGRPRCELEVDSQLVRVAKCFTLNSKWPIRRWGAPCGLQVLDLQYVRTAAGIAHCDDNECRDQSKGEEKDFPAQ